MPRLLPLIAGFFAVAMLRGQATYWLARAVVTGTLRVGATATGTGARLRRWLDGPEVARGRDLIERWGLIAIALCYLTIGLQTLVLAGAGVLRMRWLRFTLAQIPGALAWAVIYATVGLAAWNAGVAAVAGNPISIIGLALLVGLAVLLVRRRRQHGQAPGAGPAQPGPREPGPTELTRATRPPAH